MGPLRYEYGALVCMLAPAAYFAAQVTDASIRRELAVASIGASPVCV